EFPDEVALAEVKIDRSLVDGRVRALALDDSEHGAGLRVDDRVGVRARGAQVRSCRRIVLSRPDVAALRPPELGDDGGALERLVAEDVTVLVVQRRFERRGTDVTVEHARVRV